MKLNITDNEKKFISGCVNLDINNYDDKFFDEVPQSSCELLIISECLGNLSYGESVSTIEESMKRVAKGGRISLSLLDFESVAISLLNGSMNSESISSIVKSHKSVLSVYELKQTLVNNRINITEFERKNNLLLINGMKV